MPTSSRPTASLSRQSTALSGVDCELCCGNSSTDRVKDDVLTITNDGRIPSSLILACSRCLRPINRRANPDAETTDWRARRGRTAQRVRREGTASAVPYPYPLAGQRRSWPHLHGQTQSTSAGSNEYKAIKPIKTVGTAPAVIVASAMRGLATQRADRLIAWADTNANAKAPLRFKRGRT